MLIQNGHHCISQSKVKNVAKQRSSFSFSRQDKLKGIVSVGVPIEVNQPGVTVDLGKKRSF